MVVAGTGFIVSPPSLGSSVDGWERLAMNLPFVFASPDLTCGSCAVEIGEPPRPHAEPVLHLRGKLNQD